MKSEESTLPFDLSLQALLDDRGWSTRALARRVKERSGWGTQQTIWAYRQGMTPPTRVGLENIAAALSVNPRYFAEYRLLRARAELDERQVGLQAALLALEEHPSLGR